MTKSIPDFRILAWDIESSPLLAWVFGTRNVNIGISQIVEPTRVLSFAARWVDSPKNRIEYYSEFEDGHRRMVGQAWRLLHEADALLSWNGPSFDTKKMNAEFAKYGLGPPSPFKEIDLLKASRRKFGFDSQKLDWVAQQLGVGQKVSHDGIGLWIRAMRGDVKAQKLFGKYNRQDVHLLIDLHEKLLPWITEYPNMNLFGPEKEEGYRACPRCGKDGTLRKDGFRTTQVGKFQTFRCSHCGGYSTEGSAIRRAEVRGL